MKKIQRIVFAVPVLLVLFSFGNTSFADVINGCTVTKVSNDTRLLISCSGGTPATPTDFAAFPVGFPCAPQTTDALKMMYANAASALLSGKLVNIWYQPTCKNAIYFIDLLK